MERLSWEVLAAAIALATGLWAHLRTLWSRIAGIVFVNHRVDINCGSLLVSYLTQGRTKPLGRVAYYHDRDGVWVMSLGRAVRVFFQYMTRSEDLTLWHHRLPIWFQFTKKDAPDGYPCLVTTLRGFNFENLLLEAGDWSDAHHRRGSYTSRFCVKYHHGRTLGGEVARQRQQMSEDTPKSGNITRIVYRDDVGIRPLRYTLADIGSPPLSTIDGLALMPNVAELVAEVRRWSKIKKWYRAHLLPWRRGYCITGTPGTGKTTIVRELAADLEYPIHVMDLATMSNEDLREAWTTAAADSPCIILVEDIDGVFHGRDKVVREGGLMSSGGLTFDCLLNCVDGVERHSGVLLVMTTNHIEHVDPALLRSGRLDRTVVFGPLDLERRLKLGKQILGDIPRAKELALETGDVPASEFTEMCCRIALDSLFGGDNPPKTPDDYEADNDTDPSRLFSSGFDGDPGCDDKDSDADDDGDDDDED